MTVVKYVVFFFHYFFCIVDYQSRGSGSLIKKCDTGLDFALTDINIVS